ncbi:hypothetical protein O0L34_g7881 [Tuta absoluta]|nr:hypothetical protein O0L34_g7881 [Tuta absoluta]
MTLVLEEGKSGMEVLMVDYTNSKDSVKVVTGNKGSVRVVTSKDSVTEEVNTCLEKVATDNRASVSMDTGTNPTVLVTADTGTTAPGTVATKAVTGDTEVTGDRVSETKAMVDMNNTTAVTKNTAIE